MEFKGLVQPKLKIVLNSMLLQTYKTLIPLWNTNEDIVINDSWEISVLPLKFNRT